MSIIPSEAPLQVIFVSKSSTYKTGGCVILYVEISVLEQINITEGLNGSAAIFSETVNVYVPAGKLEKVTFHPICKVGGSLNARSIRGFCDISPILFVNIKSYASPQNSGLIIFFSNGSVQPPLAIKLKNPFESPKQANSRLESTNGDNISKGFITFTSTVSVHPNTSVKENLYSPELKFGTDTEKEITSPSLASSYSSE